MAEAAQAHLAQQDNALSGPSKVALLLLALGKQRAAKILKRFDVEDLKLVTRSVKDLPRLSGGDLEQLIEEFALRFSSGVNFVGSASEVREMLADVMAPEEIDRVMSDQPIEEQPVWQKASALKVDVLRAFLLQEHPQTATFIVSKFDPETAAKILTSLPGLVRSEVLRRMLVMRPTADATQRCVETVIRETLLAAPVSEPRVGIADILNRLDKSQSDEILKNLLELRPDEAKALKALLFTFDDLTTLPQRARTVLFDQVPIERLVLALRGVEAGFQATILSSLASRSKRMVEAELQTSSAATPKDIAGARRQIVETVLKLIAKGEIEMPNPEAIDEISM